MFRPPHLDRDPAAVSGLTEGLADTAMVDDRLAQVPQVWLADMEVASHARARQHGLRRVVASQMDASAVQVQAKSRRVHGQNQVGCFAPSRDKVAAVGLRKRFDAEPYVESGTDPPGLAEEVDRDGKGLRGR